MALTQISTQGIKDGTITGTDLATNVDLVDDQKLRIGTGNDLLIWHGVDGSENSYITQQTSKHLIIKANSALQLRADTLNLWNHNQSERYIACTNNSSVELYYDNTKKFETTSSGVTISGSHLISGGYNVTHSGSSVLQLFSSTDSFTCIKDFTDDLRIRSGKTTIMNEAQNETLAKFIANGSVELYYDNTKKFETTADGVQIYGLDNGESGARGDFKFKQVDGTSKIMFDASTAQFEFLDNSKATFGTGDDLQIYHDGSHSYVKDAGTGNLRITSDSNIWIEHGTENMIVCNGDGSVELYHDNSKKLETYSGGVNIFGRVAPNEFQISDNEKAYFGTGLDLEIYHDGSNSYLKNAGTGNIIFLSDDVQFKSDGGGNTGLTINTDGAVELYYNNSKKLETTSEGIQTAEKIGMKYSSSQTNLRQTFYQQIAASGSHTFQVGNVYGMGTVTTFGSRGPTSPNATLATGKIFPIHVRAGATAGLGSQIGNDLGGASGGFSYSVAAASQGITVTNGSSSFAINVFVTFDLTGFV